MFENGTKINHHPQARNQKSQGEGTVRGKRKVPRSSPVAWEYLIEWADGKQSWINRYDVKGVDIKGHRSRGTPHPKD